MVHRGIIIILLVAIFYSRIAIAQQEEVRVLSWWGFLSESDIVERIESKCNIKLNVDEYYTNSEFMRREEEANYDIYIYSETASDLMERKLESNETDLSMLIREYHPTVKEKFQSEQRKKNTIFLLYPEPCWYQIQKMSL